ncbi:MAG TPA: DUF6089 family protein [Flavobacteriaceae bacterium]|nr:hypothetical protein [Flavobacteriaceae bacterium]MCB9212316.1 hypothetical protein [Alteromonas sp.]HPF12477.1 DUF6089 family protein [Flavobacteriaceae bacterium]HQU22264.1 DUF6089 family protein [Flavobacteriaceae bacterium]HQU65203.1 DUF6089 family protein [Flavobacteriaceae bacterium]
MRHFAAVFFWMLLVGIGHAQTFEIGGFLGGSNYIGDIGKTNYIAPNNLAFGGVFKWNRSARHSFRGSIVLANIEGNDGDSPETRRKERGYSFKNSIAEVSAGIEYTFWEFNLHSGYPQTSPYLYTGVTYFIYNALYKGADNIIRDYDTAGSFAIPMVVGVKTSIGSHFVLGMEIGARYTFTDDLDGSYPVNGLEDEETLRFGNINSDDWYVFTGVTLTVTFGRQPCYCNF